MWPSLFSVYRGQLRLVKAEPIEEATKIAEKLAGVEEVQQKDGRLRLTIDPEKAAEINAKLVEAGLRVSELRPAGQSLEDVFLQLTGEPQEESENQETQKEEEE
ncbi:hypothetical protein BH24ACT21_BH24ACT21_12050 [soil metagenome]